jgi:type I restriction enzyme, S subunit
MTEWSMKSVEECLDPFSLGALPKLQTGDYKPSGKFPIIDQGQGLIAGWTDDDSGLISSGLPIIVYSFRSRCRRHSSFEAKDSD